MKRIVFILMMLVIVIIDAQPEEAPMSIKLASKITLEVLNAPELQEVSIEEKISLLKRITTPNHIPIPDYTIVENAPISLVIGIFEDDETWQDFMYFYTKDIEKYHEQSFSLGWWLKGCVIDAKIRKYDGRFLMELLLAGGVGAADWQQVDAYTLRWDGQNWKKVWHLAEHREEVVGLLNLNKRFCYTKPDFYNLSFYNEYANFSDINGDGIDELTVIGCMHDEKIFPFSCEADCIDVEIIFEREGDKFTLKSAEVKQTSGTLLREFIGLLRCGDKTELEKLVSSPSIIKKAEEWGLGNPELRWQFIEGYIAEQLPASEQSALSNIGGEIFWNGKPPFFIAYLKKGKLVDIQRAENLTAFDIGHYSIHEQSVLPKIDGIVPTTGETMWGDPRTIEFITYRPHNWKGSEDLSADVYGVWSSSKLYVGIEVTDDIVIQAWGEANLWKGDHVEIWLDTDLEGDAGTTEINDDDFQIGISPGNFEKIKPEVYCWFPKKRSGKIAQAEVAAIRTNWGYKIEATIPFEFLQITPESGKKLGFALLVSDTDEVENPQKCMLSIFPDYKYAKPTTWGILQFW